MLRRILPVALLLAACGDDAGESLNPDAGGSGADSGIDAGPVSTCNPIVGDDCATPFPSAFFEPAAATTTGVAIALPADVLPTSSGGIVIKPDRLNGKDGFSPSTPFLVYFAAGVDATQLPGLADLAGSTAVTSTVQVIEYDTGTRVPVMAELDANAFTGERQSLIIRPQVRLKTGTRYIIALVGLRDRAGQPLVPAPFKALRDDTTLTADLAPLKARYQDLFTKLVAYGVPRASLTLAWDVITSSDATSTGHLVGMRDEALARVDSGDLGYRVVSSVDTPTEANRMREVKLMVESPWYLDEHNLMRFTAAGKPMSTEDKEFPVTIEIPRCAATATKALPIVVFGHGLFGNAEDTLEVPQLHAMANAFCMILVGADWIGLSSVDLPIIIAEVLPDLNKVYVITDRLQQGHVHAQVMTRMLKTAIKDDAALHLGERAIIDGNEMYYFGISNGGIQGGAFMALSKDVERGVLNVPGCEWSLMIFRSTQFNPLSQLLTSVFPDPLDRQLLVAASQTEWDHSDPATFAPHLLNDPLPGVTKKRVILQESIGDAQVPNMATRILARTIGVPGVGLVQPVPGITEAAGPVDSAYTQWDRHIEPKPPATNVPAPADNGAHNAIQAIPELLDQIKMFFTPDGRVVNTCGGPCDFP